MSDTSVPWTIRLVLSVASTMCDAARRSNGTINRRLATFIDFKSPPTPTNPLRSIFSSDVSIGDPSRHLWFRLYTPSLTPVPSPLPVIIFFHGGGFSFLSAASRSYDLVCRRFALKLPAIVVSVNYRLTPEHRYPSQYDDGYEVLQYLDSNRPPNADLSKCFLAGDSAGANLAHHLAVRACRTRFELVKVIGLISIQPFFGGEERTESEIRLKETPLVSVERTDWLWKAFLPEGEDRDHYAVNVSGRNAEDITALEYPETVVVVGGLDPLQDWQRRYYEWLKKSGKKVTLLEYPNMFHAFYVFPELPLSSHLFTQMKSFVDRVAKS
ncbi:hypothetical protein K2173_012053 [Erythroxylum novogranatense]|uniref:Alpha/beta hydrolase fold-3 domain-containing protein n=1 Tax=Erythroxylum novogranatense TaxID=1862640 RepID=A0AAV8TEN5_9ROSI|nr:hypothetical protein K2173_012053 [Erythroxylum novogranatense]